MIKSILALPKSFLPCSKQATLIIDKNLNISISIMMHLVHTSPAHLS